MSDDIIDPKLVAHWFATVQRARAELNIYAAAYGPSRDTEKTISQLDALLAGAIPDEIDDWSETRILDLARRAGLFGFEDRHTNPLLRFARALLASPQATASGGLMAEPVEIPNPDGWMTVKVDGLPDVGETVLGGLWHTDTWLKPEFARRFMFGTCRVFKESNRKQFPLGKSWSTFGPSHDQITHWTRITPPADSQEAAAPQASSLTDAQCDELVARAIEEVAKAKGLDQSTDLNGDITTQATLRRAIVRAAYQIKERR